MKFYIFKRILILAFFLIQIGIKAQFNVDPVSKDLGDVTYQQQISFDITITNFKIDGGPVNGFGVSIEDQQNSAPCVTSITPATFYIYDYGGTQTITISGTYDGVLGSQTFVIIVSDWTSSQFIFVSLKGVSGAGVGDYLTLTASFTDFDEQEQLFCSADFEDFDPDPQDPDYMTSWNMTMKIFSNEGEYEYVNIDQTCCSSYADWYFTAPNLPTNLSFFRNEDGQVFGECIISGYDNDGYYHEVDFSFGINKEPETPTIYILPVDENSIKLYVLGFGCKSFQIFYDTDPGEPYNGIGLLQGNSPIIFENSTIIQLDGLEECTEYFFAVKAFNDLGVSDFSDEKSIVVFDVPNSLPINYNFGDISISDDFYLDDNQYFMGNLIIESGATLELNGGIMYFEENSKIIIEPGGKLTLDGATCTGVCGQTWQGIEVWGNYSQHQYTINGQNAQGQLILMNDAVIENAVSAVELWKPNDYTKTGGIVQATDAVFRNNTKSIHAISYTNFSPFIPGRETDNLSYFNNCVFELDGDYIPGHTFYKHADLDRVKGIKFRGCDFTVTPVEGVSYWNSAIASYSAGFGVEAICTSNTIPCSEYDKCTFTGFNSAIHATRTYSNTYSFNVNRAVFTDNIYGVQVENVNNFSVLFSDFFIGHNAIDEDECEGTDLTAAGYGISSSNSTGFAIEENYFTKATGAPAGYYTGIRVAETNATDEIYLNQFYNLSYGIYAEGKNWWLSQYSEGLSLLCNDFTGSYRDIVVEKNPALQGGIQSSQGSAVRPAGNDFINNTGDYKIYNNGNYPILYYYDVNSGPANPNPSYEVGPIRTYNGNNCQSHYGGGGGAIENIVLTDTEKLSVEQEYLTALNDYNNVKNLYDNLQDGGDTEGLKAEVETAWPDDTWELRAVLLGKSPHLSTEVLKAAADKTEVLPESILFEILAANPDELRKEELIKYLEDKENPLPQYMINILRQVAYGTTYKTALQNQMSENTRLKTRASNDMLRSILNEEETDYGILRNWLDNLGGLKADLQIIETYLAEGNLDDAVVLAGMIPQLYNISDYDLVELDWYMEILDLKVNLLQQGRKYDELTGGEVAQLETMAKNSHGTAGAQARAILEQGYGHHFCDCLNNTDNQGFKSTAVNLALLNQALGVSCTADPNPASEWAAFDYTLPKTAGKGEIKISDATGRVVKVVEVVGTQGQYVWDTREVKPGVYFYTFVTNGIVTSSKLVITK